MKKVSSISSGWAKAAWDILAIIVTASCSRAPGQRDACQGEKRVSAFVAVYNDGWRFGWRGHATMRVQGSGGDGDGVPGWASSRERRSGAVAAH